MRPNRAEIALDPFAHHGIGDLPDVEFWIETARDAFDHHHGLLQQDQFGSGPHVEQAGDLKQQASTAWPSKFLRAVRLWIGSPMARMACAKFSTECMSRHVASLEMHFGRRGDSRA